MTSKKQNSGSIIVTILVLMVFFTSLVLSLLVVTNANVLRARGRLLLLQAQYSAESGADAAIAELNSGNDTYGGSATEVTVLNNGQYRSTFTTSVTNSGDPKERVILATGYVYSPASATSATYTRKIRITAERTSSSTASALTSRNIVHVGSGVKNIVAKDAYVNGFIQMDKNTNNFIAEEITVAGKNTSASNCSIGGSGDLEKPASFTDPSQTKTILRLAYNNCVTPPGNTSNGDFDVSVNQSTISTIQSMYIPWSQYMDASYTAAGSCADWTTGGSTRDIPSVSASKKTHYPDDSNSVSASCGSSGDINLGSNTYNITDNVHVRADFCSASACEPTFNNPDSTVKYIFVEGTINFDSVHTAGGSGPIVMVAYGADPASKAGKCPHGGAIYLGKGGSNNTYAPQLYLLAINGICMDGTKFGSGSQPSTGGIPAPALGGIGGKNIYVATNSGSPWDLALDPTFPTDQIPIDLSWRQVSYERL